MVQIRVAFTPGMAAWRQESRLPPTFRWRAGVKFLQGVQRNKDCGGTNTGKCLIRVKFQKLYQLLGGFGVCLGTLRLNSGLYIPGISPDIGGAP